MGINMNSKFLKTVICLFAFFLLSIVSYAQKFKSHAVKVGESLESISKMYNISIDDILTYNKEVKKGQKLSVNTILIVPAAKNDIDSISKIEKEVVEQEKPIRFIEHKTKRKETLYSLTKEYSVKEEDIKKYNPKLYSEQLKKGMILRIPVYKKIDSGLENQNQIKVEVDAEPDSFTRYKVKKRETLYGIARKFSITQEQIKRHNKILYSRGVRKGMQLRIPHYITPIEKEVLLTSYTVKAKETRWSIAHKYGITVDSLLLLNPELPKSSNYLAEGQQLKIPERNIIVRDSIDGSSATPIPQFILYTVPAKMTYYSLEKAYGVSESKVKELNPSIGEKGLQEGMQIKIPTLKKQALENKGAINSNNFIFYVVRQGQGEMSLSRDLGIPFKELVSYNPDLKDGIKNGMVLKIPIDRSNDFNVKNSLILPKINLADSINVAHKPKLMVLLPFRLDILDINDKSEVKRGIDRRTDTKLSLGLYSGMQIALDYIKSKGLSVDVKTFDTQSTSSVDVVKEILATEDLNKFSAIIGPLDSNSVQEVAKKASFYNLPVVAPYISEEGIGFKNIFYSKPSDDFMREKMLDYVSNIYTNENIIIIADSKNAEVSKAILAKFPKAKVVNLIKDITIHIDKFRRLLSKSSKNWVFVETSNIALSKHASSVINSLNTKSTEVKMFTTNLSKAFDRDEVDNMILSNLNFTYPSMHREIKDSEFKELYKNKFGTDPDKYAARGFDLMYDMLLKLAYKNDLFEVSKIVGETEYIANKFNYVNKATNSGFVNTAVYIMEYKDMEIVEVQPKSQE